MCSMTGLSQLLEEADAHCHLRQRLELMPESARARGVFFRSIDVVLEQAGHRHRYRELFPARQATVLWYPARDFLLQLVAAAAILVEPSRVHEGMFEIGRANARVFADSLLGKLLVRTLSRDPQEILRQGLIGHRQGFNQGTWSLTFLNESTASMQMNDEYLFIDSYLRGAAQGTFDALERPVTVEVEPEGPFHGRHILRW